MSIINILDKSIFNKIAAGEVVENPASVIKELVENAIDAKSTNIQIEILNGGITKIRVSDNGCGMETDDLSKAFMPHATSKIKVYEDLNNISTLGFRGEALSSIASVSKVTLISNNGQDSNKIYIEGGDILKICPHGAVQGTSVIVEDIFFNVPARAKFLRKPRQEENEITNYIARFILSNPNISFKYVCDNKLVYQSFGTGLYDAIYVVYGKQIVDNLFEIDYKDDFFKINGYLGVPTFTKANRTYQTLIINGRYVINQQTSVAVYKAYENFLMKGNFPFFVLNINTPLDQIDVNVHPNKLDVKLENANKLFGVIYSIISDKLYNIVNIKKVHDDEQEQQVEHINTNLNVLKDNFGYSFKSANTNATQQNDDTLTQSNNQIKEIEIECDEPNSQIQNDIIRKDNVSNSHENIDNKINQLNDSFGYYFTSDKLKTANNELEKSIKKDMIENIKFNQIIDDNEDRQLFNDYTIIGVIFNTYIIIQKNNCMYLIDQHAAHERIIYDKFKNSFDNSEKTIQPLLIPFILNTNWQESNFLVDNIEIIKNLGFDIDEFGNNCFKISAVPVLLKDIDLKSFFDDILKNLDSILKIKLSDVIEDYLAKSACRAAVKANDDLTKFEIDSLLNSLSQQNQVLLCPHGRPVILEIQRKEIEKWFKRIV